MNEGGEEGRQEGKEGRKEADKTRGGGNASEVEDNSY